MSKEKAKTTRVKWTLDYTEHQVGQFDDAKAEDRESIIAYGGIVEETWSGGVCTLIVEYDALDGWDARGKVEETSASLGYHASWTRIE